MKRKKARKSHHESPLRRFYHALLNQIRTNRTAFVVYLVLRAMVLVVIIRCAVQGRWESVFVGILALVLLLIPPFVEKSLKVELPTTLEILVYCFVFCAEILGEIECYYVRYPLWDTMLHTVNGFMFAAVGFCMVDLLNRSTRFRFQLSPAFLGVVAFCFSMTIGVLWEFFEFFADMLVHTDMQKDFLVNRISSVTLDPTMQNRAVQVTDIVRTTIETASGEQVVLDGYLDIGLIDTMKDLFVNFIGATVFSCIGYFYVKHRGKGKIANQFIPVYKGDTAPEPAPGEEEETHEKSSD